MKYLFVILLMLPTQIFATDTLAIVNSIRTRYYSITKEINKLRSIKIDNAQYYLSNGKITIAKLYEDDGIYEFYYDVKNNPSKPLLLSPADYRPYFVYHDSKDKNKDIRAYYSDQNDLVKYVYGEKTEIIYDSSKPDSELFCKNSTLLNTFFNVYYQSVDNYDSYINDINKVVSSIRISELIEKTEDTSDESDVSETKYYDKDGKLLKSKSETSTGNSDEIIYSYFKDGNLMYILSWSSIYAFIYPDYIVVITKKYYRHGKIIKSIEYSDFGCQSIRLFNRNEIEIEEFSSDSIVPEIKVY